MDFKTVVKSQKLKDDSIELFFPDSPSEQEKKVRFSAIRGGVSWPTPEAPAYFCIVGQLYKGDQHIEPGQMVLMAEYESDSLSLTGFYNKLIVVAKLLHCRTFYAAILHENRWDCGNTHDFEKYCSKRDSDIHVSEAYDPENFMLGISRIHESLESESLTLPDESIIRAQLIDITRNDIRDGKPEERYHAANGLRHVLASYHRYPPTNKHEYVTEIRLGPARY